MQGNIIFISDNSFKKYFLWTSYIEINSTFVCTKFCDSISSVFSLIHVPKASFRYKNSAKKSYFKILSRRRCCVFLGPNFVNKPKIFTMVNLCNLKAILSLLFLLQMFQDVSPNGKIQHMFVFNALWSCFSSHGLRLYCLC